MVQISLRLVDAQEGIQETEEGLGRMQRLTGGEKAAKC